MGHTFSTGNRDCYFNKYIYTPLVLTARCSQFGFLPGVPILSIHLKKTKTKMAYKLTYSKQPQQHARAAM